MRATSSILLTAVILVGCESQPEPKKQDPRWGPTWASDLDQNEREREAKEHQQAKASAEPPTAVVIKGKPSPVSSTTKTADDPDRQARIARLQFQAQQTEHGKGGDMIAAPSANRSEGYPDHVVGLNVFYEGGGISVQFRLADTKGNDLAVKGSVGVVVNFPSGLSIAGQHSKTVDPQPIEAEALTNGLGQNLVGYRMNHITGVTGHGAVTLTFYPDAGGEVKASAGY